MRDIRIGAAQFEARDGEREFNFQRLADLAGRGVAEGAEIVSFHECCLTGYTFLQGLSRADLRTLAEPVPDGPSTKRLAELAGDIGAVLLAGLVEVDGAGDREKLYNTYVAVGPEGLIARHRKLHAFISPHLSWGEDFTVFDLSGARCSILTCYDNNLVENPRIMALMGAEIVFAPHVTCCLDSPMPGRGRIDRALWDAREQDPAPLRMEFDGPKGRGWLMRWLPARAYDNGLYYVFTNAVGVDHDTVKNGNAMILDPFGEILVESRALGDDVVTALCTDRKLALSSGGRFLNARRPDLYSKLVEPLPEGTQSEVKPGWRMMFDPSPDEEAGTR
jgi:predicted amidohydrolase